MGKKLKQGGNRKSNGGSGHTKARPVPACLEDDVRIRTGQVMTAYGVAHSTMYQRMRDGKIPRPDGDDGRPWWWTRTISAGLKR